MKKNVAGQVVGAQMVSASDGSAFTSSVTVAVTGDGGTQATGSVGSGACTHEGNGFHTYAPAQAETNYDHVAFTFTGTGAIPATVQMYTTFPQTGDSYARIGAPAGASISADVAAVKTDTAAILTDTGTTLDTAVSAIKAKTDNLPSDPADQSLIIAATNAITALLGTPAGASVSADIAAVKTDTAAILTDTGTTLDAAIATIDTNVDAIKAKTDSLTFTVAGQVDANVQSINDVTITGDGQAGTLFGV